MKFQLLDLDDGDIFRILRFITFMKRENVISHNKRLNWIALDNNKNLQITNDNLNTIMKLVKKIRCFNQFDDQIKITFTREFRINFLEQIRQQLDEKDLRQLEICQSAYWCTNKEAKEIAQNFKHLKALISFELWLGNNEISAEGAKEIAQNFVHLIALKSFTLNLWYNMISDQGALEIAQNFNRLQALTKFKIYLGDNGISAAGAIEIAQNFKHLSKLTTFTLDLKDNKISADGAKEIAQNFMHLQALTKFKLCLGGNGIGEVGAESIAEGFCNLQNLKSFSLDLRNNDMLSNVQNDLQLKFRQINNYQSKTFKIEIGEEKLNINSITESNKTDDKQSYIIEQIDNDEIEDEQSLITELIDNNEIEDEY